LTPDGLLLPLLLPKIYPPLFTLFALHNEDDEKYWRRIRHWNKQSDIALMSYLGLDE
jgi:amyotrophic lateral sclerosis 2 protein